jgi:hypothetical protein
LVFLFQTIEVPHFSHAQFVPKVPQNSVGVVRGEIGTLDKGHKFPGEELSKTEKNRCQVSGGGDKKRSVDDK